MFWGLILKANKKYSQTVTKSFHVSCAALDQSTVTSAEDVQVMLVSDENAYLLCTLRKGAICQVPLDLNFAEGDKISFSTKGTGIVHLTGYLIPDQEDFDMDESDEDEEGEDNAMDMKKLLEKMGAGKKIKPEAAGKKGAVVKKAAEEEDSDDDDAEEAGSDEEAEGEDGSDDEDLEFEDADSDDDDSDDAEAADSDEEVEEPKPKVQKLDAKKAKTNGVANGKEQPKETKKDKKAAAAAAVTPVPEKGQKRSLAGGVIVEELRVGTGLEAKNGKKVQVYYEGRLKTNNKVFDSTKNGPGFKFALGRGDVIKGWDLGVAGMKVGGKRRITCPPAVAYGAKGSPPVIPPNSTLVFDVELKNVL